jgi:hypothetical protein
LNRLPFAGSGCYAIIVAKRDDINVLDVLRGRDGGGWH